MDANSAQFVLIDRGEDQPIILINLNQIVTAELNDDGTITLTLNNVAQPYVIGGQGMPQLWQRLSERTVMLDGSPVPLVPPSR